MSDNDTSNDVAFDFIYDSDDDEEEVEKGDGRSNSAVPRYVPISPNELDCIENSRHEVNTVKQTGWAAGCFEAWLKARNIIVDFKTITKTELGPILREFYATIRTAKGEMYGISSYAGIRAGLNRHINEAPLSRNWNLMQDPEFIAANNVFKGILKKIRKAGRDKCNHHPPISAEDLHILRTSPVLQPNNPKGLLYKVWFDIQLHFGRRGCEGNRNLKPDSFVLKREVNGRQFFTMATSGDDLLLGGVGMGVVGGNKDNNNHRGQMFEEPGNPLCPVASLSKYLSKIPADAKALYLQPKRIAPPAGIWYSTMPLGINHLGQMLPRLCLEAGTSVRYTNHSLRATAMQMMSEGGLPALTDSRHRHRKVSTPSSRGDDTMESKQVCLDLEKATWAALQVLQNFKQGHTQVYHDLEKATQGIIQALQREVDKGLGISRSLSEQVEANKQLKLKNDELQKQLEEKDDLLARAHQRVPSSPECDSPYGSPSEPQILVCKVKEEEDDGEGDMMEREAPFCVIKKEEYDDGAYEGGDNRQFEEKMSDGPQAAASSAAGTEGEPIQMDNRLFFYDKMPHYGFAVIPAFPEDSDVEEMSDDDPEYTLTSLAEESQEEEEDPEYLPTSLKESLQEEEVEYTPTSLTEEWEEEDEEPSMSTQCPPNKRRRAKKNQLQTVSLEISDNDQEYALTSLTDTLEEENQEPSTSTHCPPNMNRLQTVSVESEEQSIPCVEEMTNDYLDYLPTSLTESLEEGDQEPSTSTQSLSNKRRTTKNRLQTVSLEMEETLIPCIEEMSDDDQEYMLTSLTDTLQEEEEPNTSTQSPPNKTRRTTKNRLQTVSLEMEETLIPCVEVDTNRKHLKGWRHKDIDAFIGPEQQFETPVNVKMPLQYFKSLFTDEMIEHMTYHTNLYSAQETGNPIGTNQQEIESFLAIHLYMGVFNFPAIKDYWCPESRLDAVADIISVNRFRLLRRYVHFNDNTQCNGSPDRFFKIRPLFEMLRQRCLLIPATYQQSVDEVMVAYKGTRAGNLRKHVPNKPEKWGFKLFCRASSTGIIHDFILYQGSSTFFNVELEQGGLNTLGSKVVTTLSTTIAEPRLTVLFCDNFFTSFSLFQSLRSTLGLRCVGATRENRTGGAPLKSDTILKREGRGAFDYVSKEGLLAVKWFDDKCVSLLSTAHGVTPLSSVQRSNRSTPTSSKMAVPCPSLILAYNEHMGGVDSSDMLVHSYKTPAKSWRWYYPLFAYALDLCVSNAWLVYKRDCSSLWETPMPLKNFRLSIAYTLKQTNKPPIVSRTLSSPVPQFPRKRKRRRALRPPPEFRLDNMGHWPLHSHTRGRCALCSKGVSRWKCGKCDSFLCLNSAQNCFSAYHF